MFKKVYPSHMKEKCRRPGCSSFIRKDRMKDHLMNVHGESFDLLPGQLNIGKFFQRTEQDQEVLEEPPSSLNDDPEFFESVHSADRESEVYDTCSNFGPLEKSYENVELEQEQSSVSHLSLSFFCKCRCQ